MISELPVWASSLVKDSSGSFAWDRELLVANFILSFVDRTGDSGGRPEDLRLGEILGLLPAAFLFSYFWMHYGSSSPGESN